MTDVELAVEFYLSISFRYRWQNWPHISPTWNGWRRFDCGITWYLYGYGIGCYIDPTWEWWYGKDIIMAYLLRLRCWSQASDIEWSILCSQRIVFISCGIGRYIGQTLRCHYWNDIEMVFFINIGVANIIGRYLSDIEWSTRRRRGIPSYWYSSDVGRYIGLT